MAVLKCKMCGGDLEVTADVAFATCKYCGSKQTIPSANDDLIQNLFNRANHLRIKCEFDKAAEVYEKILHTDDSEAEAHWGLVLCKYGIEYVQDPKTGARIPTCHRTSYDAVAADADYLAAIKYAAPYQADLYEAEAKAIDVIQKNILNIVKNEKPFDVFLCYKETDEHGRRTVDSAIANDIYHQLTQEGFKVFYAAITLEDKLGQEYEPYIFAALNSAKVMLVIGTEPAYFTATWVKNEWSRFLKLISTHPDKLLIPCYRNMDAYDLPEEFAHLQAQDMSKIGFINDIVRGIRKVLSATAATTTVVREAAGNGAVAPLLKRAFMFLEDRDWESADEYCEKVLDTDPENAQAYLGKLMAELHVAKQEQLRDLPQPFDQNNNYAKALRFGDEKLKSALTGYIEHINTRNENARLDGIYTRAKNAMSAANTESAYKEAATLFDSINEYQDSAVLAQSCYEKAEIARKDAILSEGKSKMTGEIISNYESALKLFESISGWKDADEKVYACQKKLEELKAKAEAERLEEERIAKRNKKIATITTSFVCAIIAFIIVLNTVIIPNNKYNDAIALMDAGKYIEARSAFKALNGYKDSKEKITECNTAIPESKYNDAIALMDAGKYTEAISAFEALDGYKDSATKITECKYNDAIALMDAGKYTEAISAFKALDGYKDSEDKVHQCKYNDAIAIKNAGKYAEAAMVFGSIPDYQDAREQSFALWDQIAARNTVAAGYWHTIGLKTNGTVVAVGSNNCGQCDVSSWTDIVAIAAGSYHTIGLKADGTVVAVGYNSYGQCDVSSWTDIVAIAAGDYHTVGLKADGTVVAVGDNDDGDCDVSSWTDIVAIAAGTSHTIGLKADGTVVAVGSNESGKCDVSSWRNIKTP